MVVLQPPREGHSGAFGSAQVNNQCVRVAEDKTQSIDVAMDNAQLVQSAQLLTDTKILLTVVEARLNGEIFDIWTDLEPEKAA